MSAITDCLRAIAYDMEARQILQSPEAAKETTAHVALLLSAADEITELQRVMEEIRVTAHCISMAGPLKTKTLDEAWTKFDQLSVMAGSAAARRPVVPKMVPLSRRGVPMNAQDWTEEDWQDLHYAIEDTIRKVAARHRKPDAPRD